MLTMNVEASVNEYFACTLAIVNKLRANKGKMDDVAIIEKILRFMTSKFNYVMCFIEEPNNSIFLPSMNYKIAF